MADDMRERITRLESSVDHLADTQEKISDTLDIMRRTLTLNEGNRRKIEALEQRVSDLEFFTKTRWYVLVTIMSAVSALMNWLFQTL